MKETFNQCDAQGVKMSAVIILSSLQLHIKKNHPKVHIRRKHCKGETVLVSAWIPPVHFDWSFSIYSQVMKYHPQTYFKVSKINAKRFQHLYCSVCQQQLQTISPIGGYILCKTIRLKCYCALRATGISILSQFNVMYVYLCILCMISLSFR